jgi:hypothetical protein
MDFLRDLIERGVIQLEHIPGEGNYSDLLTKDLGYDKYSKFARVLMQAMK